MAAPRPAAGPAQYEIRVAGVLDDRWAEWFNGLQVSGHGEETAIRGLLADQPALHGLLTKVRDLGLCLVSVRRLGGGRTGPAEPDSSERTERTMTRLTPILERNEQFAGNYTPVALAPPTAQTLIVTCLDHRVDPAIVLGLQLGEAPVIRNAGGRVTAAVIDDIAFLAYLAGQLFAGQGAPDTLFEVAVIHHTQCGTGLLADPNFRRQAATATGLDETALEASAVFDPHITVKADVERLLASPLLSPKVSVSGHVYDIATGRVTTTLDARYPE